MKYLFRIIWFLWVGLLILILIGVGHIENFKSCAIGGWLSYIFISICLGLSEYRNERLRIDYNCMLENFSKILKNRDKNGKV